MLRQANEAVDRELRNEALTDLIQRVDDWKNHRVDQFGDLLLQGHFPVVTGKSDIQKEVWNPFILSLSYLPSIWVFRKWGQSARRFGSFLFTQSASAEQNIGSNMELVPVDAPKQLPSQGLFIGGDETQYSLLL